MINILVPMAGRSQHFPETEYPFPKPLIEIGQKTIVERVVANLAAAGPKVQFIFVVGSADCRKFHLDSTLNIITEHQCKIVKLDNDTKGAACSALMAISHIANHHPLIIANSDQLFDDPVSALINQLRDADAGVVTFESVHPRWSYVRLDEQGLVAETAEKRPISRHAIAGLYYFRHGKDFVEAAMSMIHKDSSVNGSFYIAPCLNEMILKGKKIRTIGVDAERYHTFYTPQKVNDYEAHLLRRENC
ncbi:glycosyltransferase family 2 protein [Rhodoferax mekongensis]|uniref:Glycosyltransferase family 2 protein n=1 Tax=Rhodoferax mekongensis TaxID=3068341 RepID=A0ABZ0AVT7_9BURK|nr:glycosyltransferase family 2 protein [Rhodoferax sp. TBRC 17307]WNO03713.1 glycosyltransferase family 2 protein [Rhodoferax sp. TBRC 17307]